MKIYVAGHTGLVGSAIIRSLARSKIEPITRTHSELDLTNQDQVNNFFEEEKPEYIVLAAAKVGGILANSEHPGDFIRDNLLITTNVIEAARKHNCKKFCFLGSSCIYPRLAPQPLKEEYLLTGPLEPTNEAYAIAKIAGVQMIKAYRQQYNFPGYSLMPTNLFGPNDNFSLTSSHALPAMIRKFHEAKIYNLPYTELFGDGTALREWLYCDDLADIIVATLFMDKLPYLINVGTGQDISIAELAKLVKECVKYDGDIVWDKTKPNGTPRKLLNVSKLYSLGLKAKTDLKTGIQQTYDWFLANQDKIKK